MNDCWLPRQNGESHRQGAVKQGVEGLKNEMKVKQSGNNQGHSRRQTCVRSYQILDQRVSALPPVISESVNSQPCSSPNNRPQHRQHTPEPDLPRHSPLRWSLED
ncbi:hypothetical protein BDV39DRAFT_183319 [Aspergillus sergii]|uniref:Uncharacterized protein n=1 Tax=Aspergillus sergii TaxID=1034303 RepID=A0A5N6WQ07_9EURO|nr:hypothetical protein BDV39DRAFT_183319 [Aspergillus sergii]